MSQIDIVGLNNLAETIWIAIKAMGHDPKNADELWACINMDLKLYEDEKRYIEFVLLDKLDRIGQHNYD